MRRAPLIPSTSAGLVPDSAHALSVPSRILPHPEASVHLHSNMAWETANAKTLAMSSWKPLRRGNLDGTASRERAFKALQLSDRFSIVNKADLLLQEELLEIPEELALTLGREVTGMISIPLILRSWPKDSRWY